MTQVMDISTGLLISDSPKWKLKEFSNEIDLSDNTYCCLNGKNIFRVYNSEQKVGVLHSSLRLSPSSFRLSHH
jgi:hypothetical protein